MTVDERKAHRKAMSKAGLKPDPCVIVRKPWTVERILAEAGENDWREEPDGSSRWFRP